MRKKIIFHFSVWFGLREPHGTTVQKTIAKNRILAMGLLLALLWTGSAAAMGGRQRGQGLYNNDNGNYGTISVQFDYEFVGTQMKIRITNLIVGYSNKLMQNEPALHRELLKQHVYEGAQWLSSLRLKFTSEISFGAGELLHENPTISGYATSSGSDYYFFEPSEKVKKYVSDYAQKHSENFYTEHATLWGRFEITAVELYKLENKIKAVRRELKSKREDIERKFTSFISQATSEANQYNFPMAERDAKEAAALVNGNMQRKNQVRNVEQLIEEKKAEKQKLAEQAKAEAKQKKEAAEQKAAAQQAEQNKAAEQQQEAASAPSSAQSSAYGRSAGASGTSPQRSSTAQSSTSSGSSQGPYKDPALNAKYEAQKRKAEETRQKIAEMKAKMAAQQRDAQRLDAATDRTFSGFSKANNFNDYVNSSKPLVNEFARQGNAAGAYTAAGVGIGLGILKAAQANKARNEAARQEAEAKQRQWEQEERERKRREAERERLRKAAFELLIRQRHTLLEAVSENDPIPLSTTPVAGDTIYYFIYAIDPGTFDTKRTKVYVSNVFAITRYHDGTWPYQSSIAGEIQPLTPYTEVMHGYYLQVEEATNMRQALVDGFNGNDGVSVIDIAYRAVSQTPPSTGVPLSGESTAAKTENDGLGISIGPAPGKATSNPSQQKKEEKKTPDLGILLGPAPKTPPASESTHKKKAPSTLGIPIKL